MIQLPHTPAPWHVSPNDKCRVVARAGINPYTTVVAETTGYKQEREANATLIAAAPDLLECLGHLLADAVAHGMTSKRTISMSKAKKILDSLEPHGNPNPKQQ